MNESKDLQTGGTEGGLDTPEFVIRPPVDISEDQAGITLHADLPGVARDRLTLEVDEGTLTIEGEAAIDVPEDMEPLHADVRSTRYRRRFTLSPDLALDRISARMNDGVLTVQIPRRDELRPRRIEVTSG